VGFYDEFVDTGGGNFIGKEEKAELIESATPLPVNRVIKGESKFGPRYVLTVSLDGEDRALSFTAGSVESRDRMLDALQGYLADNEGETVNVVMVKVGQSVILKNPEDV
jgi:hypothetical protein